MRDDGHKSTADKGWSKMSAILDREMPVRKDRRKPFFWLFLIGLLLIAASLGAWYFFDVDRDRVLPQPDKPAAAEIAKEGQQPGAINSTSGAGESIGEGMNLNHRTPGATAIDAAEPGTGQAAKGRRNGEATDAAITLQQDDDNLDELAGSGVQTRNTPGRGVSSSESEDASVTKSDENSMLAPKAEKGQTGAMASGVTAAFGADYIFNEPVPGYLELSAHTPAPVTLANSEVVVAESGYSRGLRPAMRMAAISNGLDGLNGFTVQPHFDIPLGKRLDLHIGMAYDYFRKDDFTSSSLSQDNSSPGSGPELISQDELFTNFPGATTADVIELDEVVWKDQIRELHYLSLPVSISYVLHNRFFVEAGAAPAYLLEAGMLSVYGTPSGFFGNTLVRFGSDNGNQLKRWDLRLRGGIGFELGKGFALDLSYTHGLFSLIETDFPSTIITENNKVVNLGSTPEPYYYRNFELGVRYVWR